MSIVPCACNRNQSSSSWSMRGDSQTQGGCNSRTMQSLSVPLSCTVVRRAVALATALAEGFRCHLAEAYCCSSSAPRPWSHHTLPRAEGLWQRLTEVMCCLSSAHLPCHHHLFPRLPDVMARPLCAKPFTSSSSAGTMTCSWQRLTSAPRFGGPLQVDRDNSCSTRLSPWMEHQQQMLPPPADGPMALPEQPHATMLAATAWGSHPSPSPPEVVASDFSAATEAFPLQRVLCSHYRHASSGRCNRCNNRSSRRSSFSQTALLPLLPHQQHLLSHQTQQEQPPRDQPWRSQCSHLLSSTTCQIPASSSARRAASSPTLSPLPLPPVWTDAPQLELFRDSELLGDGAAAGQRLQLPYDHRPRPSQTQVAQLPLRPPSLGLPP